LYHMGTIVTEIDLIGNSQYKVKARPEGAFPPR
jgi:hypothetical protein